MLKLLQAFSKGIASSLLLVVAMYGSDPYAHATPLYRGFQIPLEAITSESLDDIINNWGANELRIQIGNNSQMDGTIGAEYDAMME